MITIEVPTDWLKNKNDGHRHRQYFANLQDAVANLGHKIKLTPIRFGTDFEPRLSEPDNLLLSFHSVGEAGNILRIKEAAVFPFYCFEERGHSGWSELAVNPTKQAEALTYDDADGLTYLDYFSGQYLKNRSSKYSQKTSHCEEKKGYVLYLMQIAQDPVAHFARMTQYDIIDELSKLAERTGVDVIIKRHPFCSDELIKSHLLKQVAASEHLHVSDGNVIDLITDARSVVTVNSGSGFESLLLGKAHYSVGSSEWDAISHQVHKAEDLAAAFLTNQEQKPRTKNYLAYILSEYWVDITNVMAIKERITRKLLSQQSMHSDETKLLHVEMTRDEFCRYLAMKNRHQRFHEIIRENQLLRKKVKRTIGSRIRKLLGQEHWYDA